MKEEALCKRHAMSQSGLMIHKSIHNLIYPTQASIRTTEQFAIVKASKKVLQVIPKKLKGPCFFLSFF